MCVHICKFQFPKNGEKFFLDWNRRIQFDFRLTNQIIIGSTEIIAQNYTNAVWKVISLLPQNVEERNICIIEICKRILTMGDNVRISGVLIKSGQKLPWSQNLLGGAAFSTLLWTFFLPRPTKTFYSPLIIQFSCKLKYGCTTLVEQGNMLIWFNIWVSAPILKMVKYAKALAMVVICTSPDTFKVSTRYQYMYKCTAIWIS